MGMRRKVRSLERAADNRFEVLLLPDGTQVRHGCGELLEALSASLRGNPGEHRLLDHIRASGATEGVPGLIRTLEASRERVKNESAG